MTKPEKRPLRYRSFNVRPDREHRRARLVGALPLALLALWMSVALALAHDDAVLEFDQPEVQQVRRDALEWWTPLLGDALACLTTLALDKSRYGGEITVTRAGPLESGPVRADLPGNHRADRPDV